MISDQKAHSILSNVSGFQQTTGLACDVKDNNSVVTPAPANSDSELFTWDTQQPER